MHGHLTIIAVYSPTEEASVPYKDDIFNQLTALSSATPPHDQLVILGEFNASCAFGRRGFESVVGLYGVWDVNDNTQGFQIMCSSKDLNIMGSCLKRLDIHRHTCLSNDSHTKKGIDHI